MIASKAGIANVAPISMMTILGPSCGLIMMTTPNAMASKLRMMGFLKRDSIIKSIFDNNKDNPLMLNKNIFCIKKVSLFLSMGIFIVKTFFFGYLCFINISFIFRRWSARKYCLS